MTRRDRLERKLEKRREWAESREASATQKINNAVDMTKCIPMGQPILVGHHSERGHRRLLERSDNKMRSGIEDHDMAKHHTSKADGLESQLDSCIFSDDSDAVEQIETKIADLHAERDRWKAYNVTCRKGSPDFSLLDESQRADIQSSMRIGFAGKNGATPAYVLTNLGGNIRRYQQRLLSVKSRQVREEKAEAAGGVLITGAEWIRVTFSDKPERSVLNALRDAGFRWGSGCWSGERAKLPACVTELASELDSDNA